MRDLWFVVALIWIVMAFRTKRTVRRVRGPWPVVFLVGVIAVGVIDAIAGPGGHRARWIVSSPVSVVATTMVFLGAIFAIWARLTIGSNWSGTVSHKESHELVVSGPYRFARHPIYTGLFFMARAPRSSTPSSTGSCSSPSRSSCSPSRSASKRG